MTQVICQQEYDVEMMMNDAADDITLSDTTAPDPGPTLINQMIHESVRHRCTELVIFVFLDC